jgi:hypothetical protein
MEQRYLSFRTNEVNGEGVQIGEKEAHQSGVVFSSRDALDQRPGKYSGKMYEQNCSSAD